MSALSDGGQHAAAVDAWLARAAKGMSAEEQLQLFEAAFGALWARTETTLGRVTLTAIAGRVLHNASGALPFLSCLQVDPGGGIACLELRERIHSLHEPELRQGIRLVLVEFLTVLGNLTAEILTPELHDELTKVAFHDAARVERAAHGKRIEPRGKRREGKRS